jgi:hypothetical protein
VSKKLYSTEKWKKYLKDRQETQDRNAKRRRNRARGREKAPHVTPPERRKFYLVAAPAKFSIVENPEDAIAYLSNLRFYAERHNLSLDLSGVTHLTTDAVAVLVATLEPIRQTPVYVRGNLPNDQAAQRILVSSGFFDHYRPLQRVPRVSRGQISREKSKKVQPDLARDLIHFGIKSLSGRDQQKCTAAYRVLIESMLNTHNHAAKYPANRETWWATVYADDARKRVCFTFVDTGVGIFKSVRVGTLRSLYRLLRVATDADILRDMLHGKVESSTGKSYRGKGLPAIYKLSEFGKIKSLVIIANDVFANVSANQYKMLPVAFRGTLLYWEIEVPEGDL